MPGIFACVSLCILLAACGDYGGQESFASSPASSVRPVMTQTHALDIDGTALIAVSVSEFSTKTLLFGDGDIGFNCKRCLPLICNVEKVFFWDETIDAEKPVEQKAMILLCVCTEELAEGSEDALKAFLEKSNSLIVYARQCPLMPEENSRQSQWLQEIMEQEHVVRSAQNTSYPFTLFADDLRAWSIFPIVDGTAALDSFEQLLLDSGVSEMVLDVAGGYPIEGLYFRDGASEEETYAAIERFVNEQKGEAIP